MPSTPGGLIILTPTRDTITNETRVAIEQNLDGFDYIHLVEVGLPVVEARNRLWARALDAAIKHPDWYVLHVDDDAYWTPGTIAKIASALNSPIIRADVVYGYCCGRTLQLQTEESPPDRFMPMRSLTGHFFMHTWTLFIDLPRNPWDLFDDDFDKGNFAATRYEDSAFSCRLAHAKKAIVSNLFLPVWHIDRQNGVAYAPGKAPHIVRDNRLFPMARLPEERYDRREYGLPCDTELALDQGHDEVLETIREVNRLRQLESDLNAKADFIRAITPVLWGIRLMREFFTAVSPGSPLAFKRPDN